MLIMIETHNNEFSGEIADAIKYILEDTPIEKWDASLLKQIGNLLAVKRAIDGCSDLDFKKACKKVCKESTIYTDAGVICDKLMMKAVPNGGPVVELIVKNIRNVIPEEPCFLRIVKFVCNANDEIILMDTKTREYVLI